MAARIAVKAGESGGEASTRDELPKLPLHKSRQAFAVAQRARLRAERLEMIEHHAVQHALRRITRLVDSGRRSEEQSLALLGVIELKRRAR
jgi:hypothetical protein